ncbi:hypothetical protein Tco_0961519 [Tanacetum coccineum]
MASQDARLSKFKADFKQQQSKMTNKIDTVLKAITDRIAGALPGDTVKNSKLSAPLGDDGEVMFIELIRKNDDFSEGEPEEEGSTTTKGVGAEYFDIFLTRSDLVYHNTTHRRTLEKEHTKSVYLRNEEDKRRGVEYVMSRILGFYKECLELGPKYVTGMDYEGEGM